MQAHISTYISREMLVKRILSAGVPHISLSASIFYYTSYNILFFGPYSAILSRMKADKLPWSRHPSSPSIQASEAVMLAVILVNTFFEYTATGVGGVDLNPTDVRLRHRIIVL